MAEKILAELTTGIKIKVKFGVHDILKCRLLGLPKKKDLVNILGEYLDPDIDSMYTAPKVNKKLIRIVKKVFQKVDF